MKLYHYLPAQYALENLQFRRLKIAQLNDLNDPFELIAADYSDKSQRQILNGWKKTQEKKWGVVCFSKTWKNSVMWSHYGDKHKGIVLGFNVADELLMPVRYTKKRIKIDIQKLFDAGQLNAALINKMLRTKFEDWRYEKEVRIYATLEDKDPISGLYFGDFNEKMSLTDVIAGPLCIKTKEEIENSLHDEDKNVNVVKSRLAFQTFDVVVNKQGF